MARYSFFTLSSLRNSDMFSCSNFLLSVDIYKYWRRRNPQRYIIFCLESGSHFLNCRDETSAQRGKRTCRYCQQFTAVPTQGIPDELYVHRVLQKAVNLQLLCWLDVWKFICGGAGPKLMSCAYAITLPYVHVYLATAYTLDVAQSTEWIMIYLLPEYHVGLPSEINQNQFFKILF